MADEFSAQDIDEAVSTLGRLVKGGLTLAGARSRLRWHPQPLLDLACREYERRAGIISLADPASLRSYKDEDWYIEDSDMPIWNAVREGLKATLPASAVEQVADASSKVVALGAPPGRIPIDTRGLVLGYVQSGKTTNFMSVIAKSADIGYRLVIVLTGITENLRSQTQKRLDASLVDLMQERWHRLTDVDRDFSATKNAPSLMSSPEVRLLAVVKKNPARLRRLAGWIEQASDTVRADCPILVIDDEADQASVDTGKNGRQSTINGLIRRILSNPRAQYVAYTATPFANLLIDPSSTDDLYPKDFIVPLPEPSGYFGAEAIFGNATDADLEEDGYDVARIIPDEEAEAIRPPKRRADFVDWDPPTASSLNRAIDWFLMATAARRLRDGEDKHSSMLVHNSMIAEAHEVMAEVCGAYVDSLRSQIAADRPSVRERLRPVWEAETARVPAEVFGNRMISFGEVWKELLDVVEAVDIVVDNYKSKDRLYYAERPRTVIVVGGNTLSRGLTLEGLTCSYFVRAASAYDTLLQMGRWFGFRNGYQDLVRLWITKELFSWFRDLAMVESEIRKEIEVYARERKTPAEVPVRIKSHPAMMITSAAKMKSAVKSSISYSGRNIQTIMFRHLDHDWLDNNIEAARRLVASARSGGSLLEAAPQGGKVVREVDHEIILRFLQEYRVHDAAITFRADTIDQYIRHEVRSGALVRWNVAIVEPLSGSVDDALDLGYGPLRLLKRNRLPMTADPETANLKIITSPGDRARDLGLTVNEVRKILNLTPTQPLSDEAIRSYRPVRRMGDVGLLCLYPISRTSKAKKSSMGSSSREDLGAVQDVLGAAFFFPEAKNPNNLVESFAAPVIPSYLEEVEDAQSADDLDEAAAEEDDR